MENILQFIGSTPFVLKFIISYLFFVILDCIYVRYCYRHVKKFEWDEVKEVLSLSKYGFLICGVSFWVVYFLFKIVLEAILGELQFFTWISNNTFLTFLLWEGIFLVGYDKYLDYRDYRDSRKSSDYSYSSYHSSTSRTTTTRYSVTHSESTPSSTKRQTTSIQPNRPNKRVAPINEQSAPKDPIGSVNMTNYENQLEKGISIRLDFEPNYTRIEKAVRIMKKTGAKITFYNLDKIRSYDNFISTAKKAPGQIVFERIFPADLGVIKLAEAGACFTCDCKDHSTTIPNIAKAAKRGGGFVTFINCSWIDSFRMKELRELGGSHVEFR